MKIKANNVKHLSDARYFAAKGVEWLSFCFVEGDADYIAPNVAAAMFAWVEGVQVVGAVDFPTTAAEINEAAKHWGWQVVQVGMMTNIETVANIQGIALFKEFVIERFTNVEALRTMMSPFAPFVQAFQLNFAKNGISWHDLQQPETMISVTDLAALSRVFHIILNINIEPEAVKDVFTMLPNLKGLGVNGSEEERVGVKSFDQLDDFFDVLEMNIL